MDALGCSSCFVEFQCLHLLPWVEEVPMPGPPVKQGRPKETAGISAPSRADRRPLVFQVVPLLPTSA